jgi:signal transduction histidine kinase
MTSGTVPRPEPCAIVGAMGASRRWPTILGLGLWMALYGPTAATIILGALTTRELRGQALGWLAAGAAYGAALALGLTRARELGTATALPTGRGRGAPEGSLGAARWLIAIEGCAAVAMVGTSVGSFNAVLLAIVAWQACLLLGARRAALVVVLQATIGAAIAATLGGIGWSHILNHLVLQGMGFSMALVVIAEARAREDLERTNAALAAMRLELAAQTSGAERGRIARELHDALGHHLVALSLQLEAAHLQSAGTARDAVVDAQRLTRRLLGEVRGVLSVVRDPARAPVADALPRPGAAVLPPVIDRAPPRTVGSLRWPTILALALWSINLGQVIVALGGELASRSEWPRGGAWLLASIGYGAALLGWLQGRRAAGLVALGSAAALVMTAVTGCYFCTLLLAAVAWQAGFAFSARRAVAVVVTQAAVSAGLLLWVVHSGWSMTASDVLLQVMGLSMALVACGETRARSALELANAALIATRDELAAQTREAERDQIARALQDVLGEHLAALDHRLAAASALTEGAARDAIGRGLALVRVLRGDLETAIHASIAPPRIDVPAALRELIVGLARPRAHLELRGDLAVPDAALAHTLVRCVQEMITNVLKHATADNVWIDVARLEDRVEASVSDDGRAGPASPLVTPRAAHGGHGLSGMTERLAQLGGELAIVRPPEGGWTVVVRLPLAHARAA